MLFNILISFIITTIIYFYIEWTYTSLIIIPMTIIFHFIIKIDWKVSFITAIINYILMYLLAFIIFIITLLLFLTQKNTYYILHIWPPLIVIIGVSFTTWFLNKNYPTKIHTYFENILNRLKKLFKKKRKHKKRKKRQLKKTQIIIGLHIILILVYEIRRENGKNSFKFYKEKGWKAY